MVLHAISKEDFVHSFHALFNVKYALTTTNITSNFSLFRLISFVYKGIHKTFLPYRRRIKIPVVSPNIKKNCPKTKAYRRYILAKWCVYFVQNIVKILKS